MQNRKLSYRFNNLKTKILVILTVLFITACGSNKVKMTINQLAMSSIGDSFTKYSGENEDFPIKYESFYSVSDLPSGNKYKVLIYKYDLKSASGNLGSTSQIFTYVAYAFEDDKLVFFGLPEDFLKSDNEKANEVGSRLAKLIKTTREK